MIALHGYDPTIVEDSYFRSFVSLLNPDFQVPSRVAIEEICDGIFDEARRDLKSELERTSVWVNLALDTAKTVEGSVLYVACHFIDDEWNRREMIMDTYMIVPHSVHQCPLMSFWTICLEDKDDCDVVVDKMHHYDMSHKIFSKTVGTISNLKDRLGVSCHNATYLNIVLDSIAQCLYDNLDPDFIANTYNARPFYDLTREKLEELLSQLGLDGLRAYDKHWYPCYCSLQLLDKHFSWTSEFCELLSKLWGKIYHAIKTISDHNRPTSNICLRELFKVRELLQSEIAGDSGDKEDSYGPDKNVEEFLGEARDILDRSIHDSYFTWSIPLVLDPRYKLRYIIFIFDRAFGSEAEKYISEVTRKIKELFTIHSEDGGETTDDDPLEQSWDEHCSLRNGMAELDSYPQADTELDRYLEDRLVPRTDGFDILNWWKVNSSKYPTVARMARAALAMPTSSRLSSEQISHIRSMVRGYSKKPINHQLS